MSITLSDVSVALCALGVEQDKLEAEQLRLASEMADLIKQQQLLSAKYQSLIETQLRIIKNGL